MPDADKMLTMLYRAADYVRNTPGRQGRFVELENIDEILIVGDLHGSLSRFQHVYRAAALDKHPRRHLVLQEVVHGKGRHPLGGDDSHRLLDLFAALKCQFPNQTHLLMGNHELAQWIDRPIMKGGLDLNTLFRAGVEEAYGDKAEKIYQAYLRLFQILPLALRTPNSLFVSHTIPAKPHLDEFQLNRLTTNQFTPEELGPKGVIFGLLWGRDTRAATVNEYLRKVSCDWLVTGHVPCEAGYARPSERHLIVDASAQPSSYVLLPTTRDLTGADLDHVELFDFPADDADDLGEA